MDREGDNYDLFLQLLTSDIRFIIRAAHNRCVVGETDRLKELALKARRRFTRTVSIGPHEPFLKFDSITNALAIFLPIATRMLALRSSARTEPESSCASLTKVQLQLLRDHTTRRISPIPTNAEAFLALAELGGHLKSNGLPGWLVLGRAMERLLILEQGYLSAKKT
jgi:hypothetical protein